MKLLLLFCCDETSVKNFGDWVLHAGNKLKLTLALILCLLTNICYAQDDSLTKGLKDYYTGIFPIGVAVSVKNLKDANNRDFIKKHFNSITAENCMKMGLIHPQQNKYNWKDADELVDFATKNGIKIRGHNLCWHQQTPKWFFYDKLGNLVSRDTLLNRLKEHIYAVMSRYKGKIYAWDVVNEAVSDDDSAYLRNSLWYKICGEDYIAKAFEYAHQADPQAILVYNDYNTERPEKRDRVLRLLKNLKNAGVPVHAVGLQAHWSLSEPSEHELETAIQQFSSLGLKVQITELDISIYPWEKDDRNKTHQDTLTYNAAIARKQSAKYGSVFNIFRKYRSVITSITFWNLSDRYTWLNNYPVKGRQNYPLLYDTELRPKPAFFEVTRF